VWLRFAAEISTGGLVSIQNFYRMKDVFGDGTKISFTAVEIVYVSLIVDWPWM
jgi:hypothetical protein